jgi:hypothetical protein
MQRGHIHDYFAFVNATTMIAEDCSSATSSVWQQQTLVSLSG